MGYEHESIDNTDYDVQKCLEQDQFDVATISQPTEGGIKRGVPKNVKPAPAVVAIKMAELLTVPDDEVDLNVQDSACATVTTDGNSENEADDKKKQQLLEKQRQDEKLKLEKELNQKEKLKKEEEARAIKEQEKLAKLRKKEEEKLKREDEARAKKEKDLEEKRQKQIREKIEKQKKEEEKQKKVEEAKAKKEKERKAKLEKQEKEKLGKLQKEQEAKAKKQIELAKKKSKEEQQIHDNDENKVPYDSEEGTREDFEQENDEGDTKGEFKPTESVIKRGKPQNTKPSPAVVAIKMKDLVGAPNDTDDSKVVDRTYESCTNELIVSPSQEPNTNNQPFSGENEVNDMKALHEEKFKIEMELKNQEMQNKEEECEATKEVEKLDKLKKEEKVKIKKQEDLEEKRKKQEQQKLEKQRKEEEVVAKKQKELAEKHEREMEKRHKKEQEKATKKQQLADKQQKKKRIWKRSGKSKLERRLAKEQALSEKQKKQEQVEQERQNKEEEKLKELFVEQELRRHQEMESECNTLRKKKQKDDRIVMKNAVSLLEKNQLPSDQQVDKDIHSNESNAFNSTHTETSPKLKLSSDSPNAISEPYHDSNKLTTHKDTAGNPFIDDGPEPHDQTELQPHSGTDPFDQSDLSKDHFSGEETRYEEVTTMNLADILATPDEGNLGDTEMRNDTSSKEKEGEDVSSRSFISRIKSRFAKKSPHVKRSNTDEAQCDEGKIEDVCQSVEDIQLTTADMEASPGGEVSEKQSCIKRGVPKITKPAPPVVAVKMADLLGSPEGALNDQGITEKDENVETPPKELDSSEPPTEAMERERKEKEDKLQKQQQQKLDKQKKEEEAKAKKKEDRKAKQEQKEKEQRADEAKAKKEQEPLNEQGITEKDENVE